MRSLVSISLSAFLCVACIPQQPLPTPEITSPEEKTEPVLHDSEAPIIVETGSTLPVERLLLSGILDIGDRDAPLRLLVFTEHHCRYCSDFHENSVPRLITDFVEAGKLRIQFLTFPLKKYINSEPAAMGLLCGAEQGKGLEMMSKLFTPQSKSKAVITSYARSLELDAELFAGCMEDPGTTLLLQQQKEWARSLGVEFVPTFFLNGEKFVGLPEYADLRGRIEAALREEN